MPQPTHSHSDLVSALQKFIRRGMDKAAVAVGNELLDRILLVEYDVSMWTRLWARLHIIATEDIGMAQYGAHEYLQQQHTQADLYFHSTDERKKARRPTLDAILTLCRSPKSRLTDNSYIYFSRRSIISHTPDAVYEAIQNKDEHRLLQLIASVYRQRKDKQSSTTKLNQLIAFLRAGLTEEVEPEAETIHRIYQTHGCVLYLMHLGLLVCRGLPARPCVPQSIDDLELTLSLKSGLLPDFVYDKHTKRGRDLFHRGLHHFVHEATRLKNCQITDPYYELLVDEVPEDEDEICKEERMVSSLLDYDCFFYKDNH